MIKRFIIILRRLGLKYNQNFKIMEINDVGRIITGKTPPTKNPEYYGSLMPFLTPSDIKTRKYIEKTERSLSIKGIKLLTSNILLPNSIAVTCIGSIGKIVYIKKNTITNQQINSVIPNKLIDPEFLYYFFKNNEKLLKNLASGGSVVPILKKSLFSKIQINVFTIQSQRKIGKILSDLDNKIENLHNQNTILNQIVQAIFKSWFVNFDGITEFENSELGKIPKGWKVDILKNYIELTRGVSYRSKDLILSNKALVTLKSIKRYGGYTDNGLKSYDGKYNDKQIVRENDIIIAQTDLTQNADVIGRPAIVHKANNFKILIASLDLSILRTFNNKFPNTYLYYLLLSTKFQNYIQGYVSGTTVLHLSNNAILNYSFLLPCDLFLKKFDSLTSPIIKKIHINNYKIKNLLEIQNTLLPKLMSGEIMI